MRKSIIKIYLTLVTVGIPYFILIKTTGLTIPCAFYSQTGFLCPGCGITRMFLNLSKFQITDSFFCNPAIFVLLFFWLTISIFCFIGKPKCIANSRFLYISLYVSIFSLFIFGILRNFT